MIRIKDLNKYYKSGQGTYHALKDINLTLPNEGMVFIVGKSGSGKSTLLNIIGGLDAYDSGELLIDDVNTKNFTKSEYNTYRNTYIGFIFQEFNVIKTLTIYDNIALSLELHRLNVKQHHDEIMQIIEKVGLKGKENRRMNEISGGERQRVAIARALIKNPRVIIADEPTGNLDFKNRNIIMNLLQELAKDRLVLVVTHDREIASLYGDRIITIKDGTIISDVDVKEPENKYTRTQQYHVTPVSPTIHTSFVLAKKALRQSKIRFLLIIILFAFSLIFAGSSVNLFLTDSTLEYANYQIENNNYVIEISQNYSNRSYNFQNGFYAHEASKLIEEYQTADSEKGDELKIYKSMIFDFPINGEFASTWKYNSTIKRITIHNDLSSLNKIREYYDEPIGTNYNQYGVYITDYVAACLIYYEYYNDLTMPFDEQDDDTQRYQAFDELIGRELKFDNLNHSLYIKNVILTDYHDFIEANLSNDLIKAAFIDNIPYYSSLFVTSSIYNNIIGTDLNEIANLKYFYDNIIFEALDTIGTYDNIKFMPYNDSLEIAKSVDMNGNVETDSEGKIIYLGAKPHKPEKEMPVQMAVSRGFMEKVLNIKANEYSFVWSSADKNYLLYNSHNNQANFYVCGVSRIPIPLNFVVTAIIDEDEPVIYTTELTETNSFINMATASYGSGDNYAGFPLILITKDAQNNANIYKKMIDQDITINNSSFSKLLLVNEFINDNLILFIGLFFIFCLFSILIIFNFIIINIKNSTKDIGIYMSLGMNGWKIALIYLFQVLFISLVSSIVGLIGTAIFLNILDHSFSSKVIVDFNVIQFTPLGCLAIILLAFITPILSVIFPLLSLSNKKPIDIIKVS